MTTAKGIAPMTDTMSVHDFEKLSPKTPRTGMAMFLRSLPVNTPTRMDSAYARPGRLKSAGRSSARNLGITVRMRTDFDGSVWVIRDA